MTSATNIHERIYEFIDNAPRSDYGIVFAAMRSVTEPQEYRSGITGAYLHALSQFDGEEMTVATILREEIESQGWPVPRSTGPNTA